MKRGGYWAQVWAEKRERQRGDAACGVGKREAMARAHERDGAGLRAQLSAPPRLAPRSQGPDGRYVALHVVPT